MGQREQIRAAAPRDEVGESGGMDSWLALLANSDRRAIVSHLASLAHADGASVGEIAFAAGVSRFSASRHLQIMKEAGLVDTERCGNRVHARLLAEPFRKVDDWLWSIVDTFGDAG